MTTSRTRKHREDQTKSLGIHYTPRILADFLAARALEAVKGQFLTALDPACGRGELLEALVRNCTNKNLARLVGYDIDKDAVTHSIQRLEPLVAKGGAEIRCVNFLDLAKSHRESDLFDGECDTMPKFDMVIANPPYVRTQTLGKETTSSLARRYGLTGRVDLFTVFAFAMSDALREGGVFALLCSNRFLTTRSGEPLRRLLLENFAVISITDFGDTRLFDAAVLPAVVIARKGRDATQLIPFVSSYRIADASPKPVHEYSTVLAAIDAGADGIITANSDLISITRGHVPSKSSPAEPWTIEREEVVQLLARITCATKWTMKDLAKIRVGIKTTADSVFIREDWEQVNDDIRPEGSLLRPLLTHHIANRWRGESPRRHVLYTHTEVSGRATPIDLAMYPRAAGYLESHRERLEGRSYVTEAGRQWFEIWVPHKPSLWTGPKVVFPDIAESPRFFVDLSGALVNGDCYWAACPSAEVAFLLAAVGNSRFASWFYDAQCGNKLYSGRRRFMTQYVERFPIPDPTLGLVKKIILIARRLHFEESVDLNAELEIEQLIAESFGFKEPLW